jgi:predicted transposase YbfD/YdcC
VAVDSKTLRGDLDRFEDKKAAQVLSALAAGERLVLGHVLIEGKDCEGAVAQRLIEESGLAGCVFTLDALHHQKTVELVIACGTEPLCQLKANQPKPHEAMPEQARSRPAADFACECDTGQRNRIERREVRVWALPSGSGTEPWRDYFHTLVEVRRSTEVFDRAKRCFVARAQAPAYYLSTLSSEVLAAEFACLVRQHWSIENGRHLVLDTTMTEDASRIRRNPGVFACLRQFALNLLRGNGEHNISRDLYRNALSLDRLLNYAGIRER